ncbi:prion-inhibition and propagation-domain-containing protein [Hypomontagnella submonticulosa]|nr:prion-inhibition and propagation-domain-containing protein [Hypomontagnella submonticulosa]
MEPVSLAVGITGLAGLFNNALDWFEYVQLGKAFSTDFQTSLLRLDNARLRLSRWGEAMGLSGAIDNIAALDMVKTERERKIAEDSLGQVLNLFEKALNISKGYQSGSQLSRRQHGLFNQDNLCSEKDLDSTAALLHERTRTIIQRRQNKIPLSKKIRFALYDRSQLEELVNKVIALTDDLLNNFPAARAAQGQLCVAEVTIFNEHLRVLSNTVAGMDCTLADTLSKVLKTAKPQNNYQNNDTVIMNQGNTHGGTFTQTITK